MKCAIVALEGKQKSAVVLIPSIIPANRAIPRHRKNENVDLTE